MVLSSRRRTVVLSNFTYFTYVYLHYNYIFDFVQRRIEKIKNQLLIFQNLNANFKRNAFEWKKKKGENTVNGMSIFREQRSWLNRYDYRFHAISRIAIKERSRLCSILNRTLIVCRSRSATDQWLTRMRLISLRCCAVNVMRRRNFATLR